jgi:hypothetical protein
VEVSFECDVQSRNQSPRVFSQPARLAVRVTMWAVCGALESGETLIS